MQGVEEKGEAWWKVDEGFQLWVWMEALEGDYWV